MAVRAEINKRQVNAIKRFTRNHPYKQPRKVTFKAVKKVTPKITRDVKAACPVDTGELKRSIKSVARQKGKVIFLGVRGLWYIIIVSRVTKFADRALNRKRVLSMIDKELKK